MATKREVLLPDIGDFDQVDVAEVLVSAGARVAVDESLIVLESDKASMEIPSPFAGVVVEMKVSVGDQVGEGALIAILEVDETEAALESGEPPAPAPQTTPPREAPSGGGARPAPPRRGDRPGGAAAR